MAEMKAFEDLEARLREHSLAEPPTDIEEALREAGASLVATERRRSRWLSAAAVAALLAVNLATDRFSASQLEALTGNVGPSPAVREARELLRSLNGFSSEWFLLAASLPASTRRPAQGLQAGQFPLEEIPE
jgi:hypothetical protein